MGGFSQFKCMLEISTYTEEKIPAIHKNEILHGVAWMSNADG